MKYIDGIFKVGNELRMNVREIYDVYYLGLIIYTRYIRQILDLGVAFNIIVTEI
jgi:hypothetical protein